MKNLLPASLPALALLALGGCATSGALTSTTENDGVYYSSSDHTTAAAAYTAIAHLFDRADPRPYAMTLSISIVDNNEYR